MATLVAVYNSDGLVGRCDAKCYNAKHPSCDCICGGKNHGAGFQQAMENTREMVEGWIEEYAERKGMKPGEYEPRISKLVRSPELEYTQGVLL